LVEYIDTAQIQCL